ncbi:uncharacterized protein LOC127957635 [Carassius gibelio]|uniref:uncharacterized protein LOC127957635 n=1 Tax=Carassius gibelio TaxID=101364 RepID=UPI002278A46A|nr:uncharacterized protein LOC127957635 [Carassius gibelio]
MGNEWSSAEMPRGKGFRRSQAAKKRNAERHTLSSFIDLVEDICPLPKKAPTENSDANTCENSPEKTCENSPEKTCENSPEKTCENSSEKTCENSSEKTCENSSEKTCENSSEKNCENSYDANTCPNYCRKAPKTCENSSEKNCENSYDANTCPNYCRKAPKTCENSSDANYCRKAPKTCENSSEKTSKKRWSDVTRASLVTNSDYFPQKVVRGSFHQGDARFGWNRNRQCAVNSITAVMVSVLKDVLTWTTEDLNAVLFHGDELYTSMRLQGQINDRTGLGHISVAELPRLHTLDNTTFLIKHGESFSGVFGVDFYDESLRDVSMTIEEALQRALLQCGACLLNIKAYICAVIKAGSTFAVVDPHSRNRKGMPEGNGRSIVVYCDDIYMLFNHVTNLAMSLNAQGTDFEVTSVKATVIGKTTTIETSSESDQEASVSHVSPRSTVEDRECVREHGKQKEKVGVAHDLATSTAEHSKCIKDHGKRRRGDKQASAHKLDQTYLDSSKKKRRVRTESKLANVSTLNDVIIADPVNTELSLNSADQEANLSLDDVIIIGDTRERQKDIDFTINQFHQEVSTGPEFVCSVCHRLLFRKQVIECKRDCYKIRGQQITDLAERCITEKYLHTCNNECENRCHLSGNEARKLWICYTCHRKILGGKLPEESAANNMHLVDIPKELKGLNSLEEHLIARNIPFMKLLCLPRGNQKGCHGPVVSVPVNIADVSNILPRNECDDHMIRIKLKRKLTYKGHYEYKCVSTDRVRHALSYLVRHNKWYNDVEFNEQWVNSLNADDEVENEADDFEMEKQDLTDKNEDEEEAADDPEEDITYIKEQSGLLSDTSLQPVDIGSEIIDQHFQDVLNVAPAEGNSPIRLLSDKSNEAKCFPVLYPTGGPTFHDERQEKITLTRYLKARILNADGRFAQSTDFLFYAQYISEVDQIISNVSIALRKGSEKNCLKITPDMLTNSDSLQRILNYDEGYKFLRPVRGTPPYWMSTQKDLFALIRQLGIPTFFASFSSADMRWPEMLNTIIKQEGKQINVDDLDWSEKCGLIRRNPVTAARMFDHRWHCFLKDVIMSPAKPIGKIKDYFYRVEFQQRGSPHVHCLFWVEDAPKLNDHDADNDAVVADFIDTYITCETPPENDTVLYETVNSVQKHSTRHSKTCRKKNTVCRFNFPRPPTSRTFITRERNADDSKGKGEDTTASEIIKKVKAALNSDVNFDSVDAFFSSIGINQTMFEKAYNECSKKKSIVLKRNPKDVWVNQYNRDLLRAWQGNMDIQYVTDAFSVVVYILSYITKAEQEMGLLLQRAQNEAMNGNLEAKASLKQLGSMYLHNREISAQEAVYRLTGMHLKECSRKVQFIPIGQNPVKMSLPLHVLQNKVENDQSDDESNFWMTSITDRYKNRPEKEPLENLCLASFCSEYRVLAKSEVSSQNKTAENEIIKLNNNNGHVKRRTRTEPAVVRYPRFSPTKDPEKYYHSLLQLFLPHYDESDLKPSKYNTYEEFYNSGVIKIGCELKQVKSVVDGNRALFEKESDKIDEAKQLLEQNLDLEDAWAEICPETEKQRDECIDLMKDKLLLDEDDSQELIPDLTANPQTVCTIETNHTTMPRDEALHLLRSLNEEQSAVFYKVQKWCLQKVLGQNPEPFRLFLTGGAGTGKSHLIKAIQYESTRLLSQLSENPDDITVLLTASTGVASFGIGGGTVHNNFAIGANVRLPYQPLSDNKINSLRTKLGSLHILIIDEVSMVDHRLLSYIHGRLRQIKQTGDYSLFGKVSILCVGDFYQLPPVKGTALYADTKGVNLWENNFQVAELTKVVRQQDPSFAQMLNRLRVHKKGESLLSNDIAMLKKCETGKKCNDIHIFATNAEVDKYNIERLHECCPEAISIYAQDYVKNSKTGRMERKVGFHSKVFNSCLSKSVSLGIGARVMLKKNIDVADGLVNGAFGTVVHVSESQNDNDDFPSAIHVEFDNANVGKIQRSKTRKRFSQNSTVIEVQEDHVTNDGGIRRQFPLRLACACTLHKVQGLTVDRAVVSLKKIFTAGQAYVALSRVRSLSGLIIEDFKESAIFCNDKIELAMKHMTKFLLEKDSSTESHGNTHFTVVIKVMYEDMYVKIPPATGGGGGQGGKT